MRTSFVHIGDTHLQASHPRNAARLKALDQIIDEGQTLEDLGAWLWPGDLFHARSSIQDRNDLAVRLQTMADRAPVVITLGNHDLPGDLDVFGRLEAKWPIYICAEPFVHHVRCATGASAEIAVLPYPTKGGLIANGGAADQTLQTGVEVLEAILRMLAMGLASARAHGDLTLFVGHINVLGSLASSGQPQIGKEIELASAMLDLLGDCYKGLSHIHEAQTIGGAYYAGSIAPMDWGETTPRSYVVVLYHQEGDGWTYQVTRHPIAVAPLYHVEGEWTANGFRLAESSATATGDLERRFHAGDWAGCEVRVRYSVLASERKLVDEGAIRAPFAGAARLEVEPIVVPDRALRAPEVAAAKTLADKLDAWARLEGGRAVPATVLQKLAALEHGDPTVVLSDIANQVGALEQGQKAEAAA